MIGGHILQHISLIGQGILQSHNLHIREFLHLLQTVVQILNFFNQIFQCCFQVLLPLQQFLLVVGIKSLRLLLAMD